jgi:hypothetical protein
MRECATRRRVRTTDGDDIARDVDVGRVRVRVRDDDDDDDDATTETDDDRDGRAFREGRADARRALGRARRWTTRRERTRTIEGWWTRRCARRIASEGDARRERETREGMGIIPRWLEDPEPKNAARSETNG